MESIETAEFVAIVFCGVVAVLALVYQFFRKRRENAEKQHDKKYFKRLE